MPDGVPSVANVPGVSSKILGLKFMQRQLQKHQQSTASAPHVTHPDSSQVEVHWSLPAPCRGLPAHARVVLTDETKPEISGPAAVLRFKPGRQSFGSFNPRLEKKLVEIKKEKAAAVAELAAAAAEANTQRRRNEERTALVAKANAHEEAERRDAVSDGEMAERYSKYQKYLAPEHDLALLKPTLSTMTSVPPEVERAVRIRDHPSGAIFSASRLMNFIVSSRAEISANMRISY